MSGPKIILRIIQPRFLANVAVFYTIQIDKHSDKYYNYSVKIRETLIFQRHRA